jgi:hypothetical protein
MSKYDSIPIHIELIYDSPTGFWGFSFSMEGSGGSGQVKSPNVCDALAKAHRVVRKEIKRMLESKEAKAERLDKAKRVAALRKSKDKGTI